MTTTQPYSYKIPTRSLCTKTSYYLILSLASASASVASTQRGRINSSRKEKTVIETRLASKKNKAKKRSKKKESTHKNKATAKSYDEMEVIMRRQQYIGYGLFAGVTLLIISLTIYEMTLENESERPPFSSVINQFQQEGAQFFRRANNFNNPSERRHFAQNALQEIAQIIPFHFYTPHPDSDETLLMTIAKDDAIPVEVLEEALAQSGINPALKNRKGYTALRYAVEAQHLSKVEELITWETAHNGGLGINEKDNDHRAKDVLTRVIELDNLPLLEALMKSSKINVNETAEDGRTKLHTAVAQGKVDRVKALLSNSRIDVNAQVSVGNGNTPLHQAISLQRREIVQELLKHPNLEINKKNNKNEVSLFSIVSFMVPNETQLSILEDILDDPRTRFDIHDEHHKTLLQIVKRSSTFEPIFRDKGYGAQLDEV